MSRKKRIASGKAKPLKNTDHDSSDSWTNNTAPSARKMGDGLADGDLHNRGRQTQPLHFTVRTGQGASRITCCAVEPKTNFPTFDFLFTPMMIMSALFSPAN